MQQIHWGQWSFIANLYDMYENYVTKKPQSVVNSKLIANKNILHTGSD